MGWYWRITKNDGRHCLCVVDMAKDMSVMEPLSDQITIGEFVNIVIGLKDKITNCNFKNMVRKIKRLKGDIKDRLLLWDSQFEMSWDIARGLYYIQQGFCPSHLATMYGRYADEDVRTKFAVVYLDSDAKMFWTLSTEDAHEMLYNYSMSVEGNCDNELKILMMKFTHFTDTSLLTMFEYIMGIRMSEIKKIYREQGKEAGDAKLETFMQRRTMGEVFAGLDGKRLENYPSSHRVLSRCLELSLKRLAEGKKMRLEVLL